MRYTIFALLITCFSYGQNIQIVVEGVSYDIGGIVSPSDGIENIHIKGNITEFDQFENGMVLASEGSVITFPQNMRFLNGKLIHLRNVSGETKVNIPGYWTTTKSTGYSSDQGFILKNREFLSMLIEQDTIHVLSQVNPYNEAIYKGKNAADPETEVNGIDNVTTGDFLVRSVRWNNEYALEFTRLTTTGQANAELPMVGVVAGEGYDISLFLDKFLSKDIGVYLDARYWELPSGSTASGNIRFNWAIPRIDNAPITLKSTANNISGARIDKIVITKL